MLGPIDTYKKINTSEISQHQAVVLLLERAVERVRIARHAQLEGDAGVRGMAVGNTITILGVLQGSLDHELGGEIAANLDSLYDYMTRKLSSVALTQTVDTLDEVEALLLQLLDAWRAIEK